MCRWRVLWDKIDTAVARLPRVNASRFACAGLDARRVLGRNDLRPAQRTLLISKRLAVASAQPGSK
jgi:hypothetical protein